MAIQHWFLGERKGRIFTKKADKGRDACGFATSWLNCCYHSRGCDFF